MTHAVGDSTRRPDALSEALEQHRKVFTPTRFRTEYPVVRVHPETGERSLILGDFLQKLTGFSGADPRALIGVFQSHVERPENTVRRQWRAGDVALWDNRATQHYGVDDSDDHERTLRRATIDGDAPAGVDCRRSVLLSPRRCPSPGTASPPAPRRTELSRARDPSTGPMRLPHGPVARGTGGTARCRREPGVRTGRWSVRSTRS